MVAKQHKKSFKTTVSIVSSNVFQKVVTIKNPCSPPRSQQEQQALPPPPPPVTRQYDAMIPTTIGEDLCCSPPVPLTIIVSCDGDEDVASEISCFDFQHYGEEERDRPPTPRPQTIRKTLRHYCLSETPVVTTCGGSGGMVTSHVATASTHDVEWPSDEEQDDMDHSTLGGFTPATVLPSPQLSSVCGFACWASPTPNKTTVPTTTPNSLGLMLADCEDGDDGRVSTAAMTCSSGSTYECREPMVTVSDAPCTNYLWV
jgi:hypothetical protein